MKKRRWKVLWDAFKCLGKIVQHVLYGVWKISLVPEPIVTVFGSGRIPKEDVYAQHARNLGSLLARQGFSIITGGGSGIMEAANMGAYQTVQACLTTDHAHNDYCKKQTVSVGIGLVGLNKDSSNSYVHNLITMDHFFTRKWLLVRYSNAFVVFPGGFGTFDEMFEVVTLQQTNRMPKRPIILFGSEYWKPFLELIEKYPLEKGFILPQEAQLLFLVDDLDEVVKIIQSTCA